MALLPQKGAILLYLPLLPAQILLLGLESEVALNSLT